MVGETRRADVERAVSIMSSCPAAEPISHHLPSPQRSFSISVNTWQTFPPHHANAFQARSNSSFCWGYCMLFFPFLGSLLLQNLLFPWCNSSQHIECIPETQSLASFPSLPSSRSMTERSMQLSLLWAGNKGQKSGAVNLPPVAISGFSSCYRNMLWWQASLLAHLRWNVEIQDFCVLLSPPLYDAPKGEKR